VTPATFDPTALLGVLSSRGVSFVAIGGWAAGVLGVGWSTFDLDVVIDPTEENYAVLMEALTEVGAEYETFHTVPIRPSLERLREATGPMLFRTKHGRLDVLKEAGGETFASLSAEAETTIVAGHTVRVASLAALLRMKRAANRPKDRKVLAAIEAALAAKRSRGEGGD
jgi:hypothetical protein